MLAAMAWKWNGPLQPLQLLRQLWREHEILQLSRLIHHRLKSAIRGFRCKPAPAREESKPKRISLAGIAWRCPRPSCPESLQSSRSKVKLGSGRALPRSLATSKSGGVSLMSAFPTGDPALNQDLPDLSRTILFDEL